MPTEDCSDWSESDSSIQPLLSSDWSNLIAVSSHCLPVGGASLANDDVMRGGGAAEIGMWRKQVRAPASSHTNLELLVIILLFIIYFIIF